MGKRSDCTVNNEVQELTMCSIWILACQESVVSEVYNAVFFSWKILLKKVCITQTFRVFLGVNFEDVLLAMSAVSVLLFDMFHQSVQCAVV